MAPAKFDLPAIAFSFYLVHFCACKNGITHFSDGCLHCVSALHLSVCALHCVSALHLSVCALHCVSALHLSVCALHFRSGSSSLRSLSTPIHASIFFAFFLENVSNPCKKQAMAPAKFDLPAIAFSFYLVHFCACKNGITHLSAGCLHFRSGSSSLHASIFWVYRRVAAEIHNDFRLFPFGLP